MDILCLIYLNLIAGMILVSYMEDHQPIGLGHMLAVLNSTLCGGCLVVALLQVFCK